MNRVFVVAVFAVTSACLLSSAMGRATGKTPRCYGNDNNATQSALAAMKNAGLIRDFGDIYQYQNIPYSLTTALLDSKRIGQYADSGPGSPLSDVYRQIQKVNIRTKDKRLFEVLTISETTFNECSISEPAIIMISPTFKVLGSGKFVLTE